MTKKILLSLITGVLLISFSACTITKPAEPERTITVSGTGDVLVKPDCVSLNFAVKTTERSVAYASERNATLTTTVINALKDLGISENDITTCDYTIYQENPQTMPGRYSVKNSLSVIIRNIELTGKIIDTAVFYAGNFISLTSFEYLVTDKQTAMRQARTLAIQNAQDAANLLAGASGCKVSTVMNIREDFINTSSNLRDMKVMTLSEGMTTPLESGMMTVSSNVTITYSIE